LDEIPIRFGHDADQLFRLGIAGAGSGPEFFARFDEAALFHQVARHLEIGGGGARKDCGQGERKPQDRPMRRALHIALLCLAGPVFAEPLLPYPERLDPADFLPFDADQARIGQLLFYDKILSGNRNISCGTCHHHDFAGSDGLSLGIGEGGVGVGPERTAGTGDSAIRKRVPRNAPALWNLGHRDVRVMFHDGRLEIGDEYENGFNSPAQEWLPGGLNSLLAAQALFPMTAEFEMAGNTGENEVIGAVIDRIDQGWPILAKRVRTIPEYGEMFVAAFDHVEAPEDVTITEIANAIAAFIGTEWQSHDAPFDRWLAGDETALSPAQVRGKDLFFGRAGCANCHAGPLFTDQEFRALALPQFGPGRTRQWDPYVRDVGRVAESNRIEDMYRFKTPSLRNVTVTGPYGHNGAYPTLEGMIRHHSDPLVALDRWDRELAALPEAPWLAAIDFVVESDRIERARHRAKRDLAGIALSDADIADLIAFLHALEDPSPFDRPLGRPETVPSGLPVD